MKKKYVSHDESSLVSKMGIAVKSAFDEIGSIRATTAFRVVSLALLVVMVVGLYNIASNKSAVEKILEKALIEAKNEEAELTIRDIVSPKIQKRLQKMVLTLDADRCFAIELHNGKKNATELPFKYFDMTYEEVNEDRHVQYVSQNFMEVLVSHYKLPFYLSKHNVFIGTVQELEEIDRRFAWNFSEQNGAYIGLMMLRSGGKEVGFLGVAYNEGSKVPDKELINNIMLEESRLITEFLDLNKLQENFGIVVEND